MFSLRTMVLSYFLLEVRMDDRLKCRVDGRSCPKGTTSCYIRYSNLKGCKAGCYSKKIRTPCSERSTGVRCYCFEDHCNTNSEQMEKWRNHTWTNQTSWNSIQTCFDKKAREWKEYQVNKTHTAVQSSTTVTREDGTTNMTKTTPSSPTTTTVPNATSASLLSITTPEDTTSLQIADTTTLQTTTTSLSPDPTTFQTTTTPLSTDSTTFPTTTTLNTDSTTPLSTANTTLQSTITTLDQTTINTSLQATANTTVQTTSMSDFGETIFVPQAEITTTLPTTTSTISTTTTIITTTTSGTTPLTTTTTSTSPVTTQETTILPTTTSIPTNTKRPLRQLVDKTPQQKNFNDTSLLTLQDRAKELKKKRENTSKGVGFKWWYLFIIVAFLAAFGLFGLVAWSAATRKKRCAEYWKKKEAEEVADKKKPSAGNNTPKKASKDTVMEVISARNIQRKGPLHLQKKFIGNTKHTRDDQKSESIREKVEFVPTLNAEVEIGSDIEIIDGMELTTYEESTICSRSDNFNTVRKSVE